MRTQHTATPDHPGRLARTRAALAAQGLDALLIFSPDNLRYLSAYSGEAAYGVLTAQQLYLVTDYRFAEQAQEECRGWRVICRDRDRETLGEVLRARLADEGARSAGIETEHLSQDLYAALTPALHGIALRPVKGLVETLRMVKDAWEIAQIEAAARIADRALAALLPQLLPGVSERAMARELDYLMRLYGADELSFPTILGFGANAARPHCVPSARALARGDFVLIDFGAALNGYRSDMTRTYVAGKASARQNAMMRAVLEAQQAAIGAVRAGVAGHALDAQAGRVLGASPFAAYAGKGLGHGVGLKLHERPFLGPACAEVLEAGCVVTVEPGLYIPGYGGVRFEDDILVEQEGARSLTHAPKAFELDL